MDNEIHIRLLETDLMEIGPGWRYDQVCSSFWRLYINKSAGAEIACGPRRWTIPAARVFLVPAWVRFDCLGAPPLASFYVHFDPVGLIGPWVRAVFDGPLALPGAVDFEAVTARLCGRAGWRQDMACLCRVKALVQEQMALVLDGLPVDRRRRLQRLAGGVSRFATVLDHIDQHLDVALDNAHLAAAAHLSESHFSRAFRAQIGQTPAQYVRERRIAAAAHWLVTTSDSIDAIAARVGFANRFHFSRVFLAVMGTPPAAYRKLRLV